MKNLWGWRPQQHENRHMWTNNPRPESVKFLDVKGNLVNYISELQNNICTVMHSLKSVKSPTVLKSLVHSSKQAAKIQTKTTSEIRKNFLSFIFYDTFCWSNIRPTVFLSKSLIYTRCNYSYVLSRAAYSQHTLPVHCNFLYIKLL